MARRQVLITGAGSGLGRALALRYAAAGAAVACADRRFERAEETAALLPGEGHLALVADVGDDASMRALHDTLMRRWQRLDVLVNNAGIASGGCLVDSTIEEWREVLEINLLGVVRGCRLFLPDMLARGRGQIVNIASFAALAGAPGIMSYGVAKAGVVALSEQLRAEVAAQGVTVSVACPAFFRTNLLESWRGDPRVRETAERMMARAPDRLDEVADRLFAAAERGEFLILPTRRETLRWRIKRWLPGWYFRRMLAATRR
ncbi:SDR family NAD(P)-dependent oxidoreductase [Rehaibacterium terrae]|jgi:NAD(P)-dependent dehydrogenase (short-subunit alcohol dehydrogenase family)|uniref:NAD(P)-dependent dehydrogenase (Short-subunit alcohol dehydrogenase family) n=1 Tax=Rehaibacterium terrae TaxID=1341696 RepID=A0A7W7XXJ6_9GAMM|nr:SDR family NAD(P)-dependent oxidoreductase [Rehaibacterium terrae]MBB5014211.1 NAD(P)-dependent dehydrogenase (short-subunit alcohol dehydrogenase family) [Rehaibacterium terrae]